MKILYIYNIDNWAIHNVGKLWLEDLKSHEVVFKNFFDITNSQLEFSKYNLVWFGYLDLYRDSSFKPSNSVISIHDPKEVFDQVINWKEIEINSDRIALAKRAVSCVTTSEELLRRLEDSKVKVTLIPTTSNLPYAEAKNIKTVKSDVTSVFQIYRRKNYDLMLSIRELVETRLDINFDLKVGQEVILPQVEYMEYLDKHEIYICTSYQEGGPLAAMDATHRGLVVLTTPVGQIQEVVDDGLSGYICNTKEDFYDRIKYLSENLSVLHEMRLESLRTIKLKRNAKDIKSKVESFLSNLILN